MVNYHGFELSILVARRRQSYVYLSTNAHRQSNAKCGQCLGLHKFKGRRLSCPAFKCRRALVDEHGKAVQRACAALLRVVEQGRGTWRVNKIEYQVVSAKDVGRQRRLLGCRAIGHTHRSTVHDDVGICSRLMQGCAIPIDHGTFLRV